MMEATSGCFLVQLEEKRNYKFASFDFGADSKFGQAPKTSLSFLIS